MIYGVLNRNRHVIPAKAGIQENWIPGQARNDNQAETYIAICISEISNLKSEMNNQR
jgi:hypothetical protein